MKLLTLNTHSLQEENQQRKLREFVRAVLEERPRVIALQEVSQTMSAAEAGEELLEGMVPVPGKRVPLRRDNYAARAARCLLKEGVRCSWVWLPVKVGYGKYDEGVALFVLGGEIDRVDSFPISSCRRYADWKTRKILGVRLRGQDDWFYTVHMGWWEDETEPFREQWARLEEGLSLKKTLGPVWLMGDFNSPAHVRGEGYDHIRGMGWQDTYLLAKEKDDGVTVEGVIDGWRDGTAAPGMRIDHIWCSRPVKVLRSCVRFDGKKDPRVSDHYGILVETEEQDGTAAPIRA